MASDVRIDRSWGRSPVRVLMWSLAAFLLLLPAVAMQFTAEVRWGPMDFAIVALMLAAACGAVELGARASINRPYRLGVGLAAATAFLLVWACLAVGVVGDEGNPANLMFAGVLAVAVTGSLLSRGKARGLALAMAVTAVAQAAAHGVAYAFHLGAEEPNTRGLVLLIGLAYTALWAVSAWCFRIAAKAA